MFTEGKTLGNVKGRNGPPTYPRPAPPPPPPPRPKQQCCCCNCKCKDT